MNAYERHVIHTALQETPDITTYSIGTEPTAARWWRTAGASTADSERAALCGDGYDKWKGRPSGRPFSTSEEVCVNKTELLNKLARDNGERLLLARALDKLELARQRNIPTCTGFLSPQERASVENLLNACGHPRHIFFGGTRERSAPYAPSCPTGRRRRTGRGTGELSRPRPAVHLERRPKAYPPGFPRLHPWPGPGPGEGGRSAGGRRALRRAGAGGGRRLSGVPHGAGGACKLKCSLLPLDRLEPPAVETRTIRDTVSSLRLDAVAAPASPCPGARPPT